MFKSIRFFLVIFTFLVIAQNTFAAVETGSAAPNFTLTDSNGKTHSLSDFAGKYVVLEWVNFQCPFVIKHYRSNNMQGLQKKYTAKDVIWLSINSSASGKEGNYSSAQINEIIKNSDASATAYLIDKSGEVGRVYGAQTTPHMYIIDPSQKLIYQGAIDSIPSFEQEDIAKAVNYVQESLDAAMSGSSVPNPSTKSYGCSVKY